MSELELLEGAQLHTRVIQEAVLMAESYVWIATANLKDMHVPLTGKRYRPILEVFDKMAKKGVVPLSSNDATMSQGDRDTGSLVSGKEWARNARDFIEKKRGSKLDESQRPR